MTSSNKLYHSCLTELFSFFFFPSFFTQHNTNQRLLVLQEYPADHLAGNFYIKARYRKFFSIFCRLMPSTPKSTTPADVDDWSDEDEDQLQHDSAFETNVLLGIPNGAIDDETNERDAAVSRIGGLPVRITSHVLHSLNNFIDIFPSFIYRLLHLLE